MEEQMTVLPRVPFEKEDFLRNRGWKHSSDTPGSYWLWRKSIDGKDYTGNTKEALSLERAIEEREAWKSEAKEDEEST